LDSSASLKSLPVVGLCGVGRALALIGTYGARYLFFNEPEDVA